MTPSPVYQASSGDFAADRRYQWAEGAAASGDFEGARDLFEQALALAPRWAPAWFGLAQALEKLGRREDAASAYRSSLDFDEQDFAGAALCLARLGFDAPKAAPRAYVKTLFDQYAARFDAHLVEKLGYRGPQLLRGAIERAAPGRIFAHALDLGCGAGLFAAHFRDRAEKLSGVDLSPAMIEMARGKNLYDRLAAADLVEFLAGEPAAGADLAVAADVFVYIGDLALVFAGVARALRSGGLFAFTVQKQRDDQGFSVGADLRYAHGKTYLRTLGEEWGLAPREIAEASTRRDSGADVPGYLAIFERL